MAEKTISKQLKGMTILLISPDRWGAMHISKHHYAKALAKLGNTVYFLNPPSENLTESVDIQPVEAYNNLFVVDYKRQFPRFLRFKLRGLYDTLMTRTIRRIAKKIDQPINLVWCFEPNLYKNPRLFGLGADYIFHPVDELYYDYQYRPGDQADLILASAQEYLDKFGPTKAKRVFINHGLADYFIDAPTRMGTYNDKGAKHKVGYAGNMLRPEIDRRIFLKLVESHSEIEFHIWGSYQSQDSNLSSSLDSQTQAFIESLKQAQNVILHGPVPPTQLALDMQAMDAFLICYDVELDRSSGTNYHKVMEYLNTGKVIISNNVTTYKNRPNLVQMVRERKHNDDLPQLFGTVMSNLAKYNHPNLQQERIDYSLENSYKHQIARIEDLLYSQKSQSTNTEA